MLLVCKKRPIALYCHNTTGALCRRVARVGLAMGNLEPDWDYSPGGRMFFS